MHHLQFEMDQKWFISSIFEILFFFSFSNSYILSGSAENNGINLNSWENKEGQLDLNQTVSDVNWNPNKNIIEEYEDDGTPRWLNVLTFDKLYNLTEKDKGLQNETKIIFINAEDHLKIYEKKEEDQQYELQEERNKIFPLLHPQGFLSRIIFGNESKGLIRTKRQAEEDDKKKCKCRGSRRRGMRRRRRRRRRRNRTGQQRPARPRRRRRRRRRGRRRNVRRRGRRRCVCKNKSDEEGKSEGEDPEVEDADGEEEGTTEGEDESGDGDSGGGEEDGGDEEGGGEEGGEEGSESSEEGEETNGGDEEENGDYEEEEEEEEEGEEEKGESEAKDGGQSSSLPGVGMPSVGQIPAYVVPYPNPAGTPIAMMPGGGIPTGVMPTGVIPTGGIPNGGLPAGAIPMYQILSQQRPGVVIPVRSMNTK